jgi:hypothetical protein
MRTKPSKKRLLDAYRFPGFRPLDDLKGVFGDPLARVVTLVRRSKKHDAAPAVTMSPAGTTGAPVGSATCRAGRIGSSWSSRSGASPASVARP